MLLDTIAAYGAKDAVGRLPEEVIHYAKRAFLDWLSALYPGTRTAPCQQLLGAHGAELGVRLHQHAGQPPDDCADDERHEQTHASSNPALTTDCRACAQQPITFPVTRA